MGFAKPFINDIIQENTELNPLIPKIAIGQEFSANGQVFKWDTHKDKIYDKNA